jgi:AbrB family looped-hinge helix DNA binding protein
MRFKRAFCASTTPLVSLFDSSFRAAFSIGNSIVRLSEFIRCKFGLAEGSRSETWATGPIEFKLFAEDKAEVDRLTMQTRVSTKGQIVLPGPLRRKLGIRAGDPLEASIESGRIVLTPQKKAQYEGKIIDDPITGLPVIDFGPDAPELTSEQVREMLADFP